ncbi:hypothetical protein FB451DRAFT_1172734 [Mycena latifolia]|nr:hypothetical protein FB451DRAFT_1172734 [Mycena latifolia]
MLSHPSPAAQSLNNIPTVVHPRVTLKIFRHFLPPFNLPGDVDTPYTDSTEEGVISFASRHAVPNAPDVLVAFPSIISSRITRVARITGGSGAGKLQNVWLLVKASGTQKCYPKISVPVILNIKMTRAEIISQVSTSCAVEAHAEIAGTGKEPAHLSGGATRPVSLLPPINPGSVKTGEQ